MNDDRWMRVKALFQAVAERPAAEREALLAAETRDDEALRRDVESLLAQDAEASFLDRLPVSADAPFAASQTWPGDSPGGRAHPALEPGHQFGPYDVVGLLGTGAMGEVYRCRDTKLNREVALKVLPPALAIDPARLARFRREAQMLAALNHINIAAIYGFEESPSTSSGQAGITALVLELAEGPTLADLVAKGPMSLARTLPVARQMAEALEAAHEQGIIHRDLKPANVKVRPDGVVKILDFGLAKVLTPVASILGVDGQGGGGPEVVSTHDGIIIGTAAYMPPEQAKGQHIDRRADIWAFGCVLFEMISGRKAFGGDSVVDVLAAVVREDPDWNVLPASVPPALRILLRRCLTKDRHHRLQAIGDARIEIEAIQEALQRPSKTERASPSMAGRGIWLASLALIIVAALFAVREWQRPVLTSSNPLADALFTRVTDWEGSEGGAEISPDGKFVAFLADRNGEYDIWISQLGSGTFRNLTEDVAPLQPSGPTFRKFGFSGDGTEIWFSPDTGPAMAQMIMPLMGGAARAFLDRGATSPAWSPDDRRIAYFRNEDGDPMLVAERNGADARQILSQKGMHNHNPVWSRDGQWIYFASGPEPTERMDVWRVRPSGESIEQLTHGGTAVNFLAPLDARTVLYIARAADRSGPWLWLLDVERKQTRRIGTGVGQYTSVSVSRDGKRVVATVANPTTSLWRVPLDRAAEERDAQPFALPTPRALAPRIAGSALFYLSANGMGDGLWRMQDGKASAVSTSGEGGLFEPAAVAPDGRRAVIVVRRDGKRHLELVTADGRSSRTLAASIEVEGASGQGMADWAPDGRSIVVSGRDGQGPGLFKVDVEQDGVVRLVSGRAANPIWSPKGDLILYAGRFFTGQVELLAVRPDGLPVELPAVRARPGGYRFLPDGSGLVYLPFIPSLDFWLFEFPTGQQRRLTHLDNHGAIGTFDVTADGQAIVFDRSKENSDIVLIELPN